MLLSREALAQSRLRKRAARSRKCTPEPPCGTTLRRTARQGPTRWPISEPTLRSDPVASPGVYATASRGSGSAPGIKCNVARASGERIHHVPFEPAVRHDSDRTWARRALGVHLCRGGRSGLSSGVAMAGERCADLAVRYAPKEARLPALGVPILGLPAEISWYRDG